MLLLYLLFGFVLGHDYNKLEQAEMSSHLTRVDLGVAGSLNRLLMSNQDWSKWDDTYEFMKSRDESYFESVVTYDYVKSLRLHHILFLDDKGGLVRGFTVDQEKEEIVDIDATIRGAIEGNDSWAFPADDSPVSGLLKLGNDYYLGAAVSIQDSEISKPSRGTLVFLERVDDHWVENLGMITHLPIEKLSLLDAVKDVSTSTNEERLEFSRRQTQNQAVYPISEAEIRGVTVTWGVNKEPLFALRIHQPRTIHQQGIDTRNWVLACLLVGGLFAAMTTIVLLQRTVINRFHSLSNQLRSTAATKDTSTRVTISGKDELANIASDINSMLVALGDSEQQLRIARDAAEAANLAKSTFVAKVSHELRTPIHSIVGMLRILFKEERSTAKRDYIKMARDAAYSLLGTINDILDFSKIESGNLTLETVPLNFREIVRDTLRTVGPRAEEKEGLELVGFIDPRIPEHLLGDPLRVKQSIINLLSNAVKFTAAGSVSVEVELLHLSKQSVELVIAVRDTGVGIPEHRLQKIFDPFTQADESVARVFQGTGLGLTIVKQLVESMGGAVSVASRVGLGTDFILRIPFERPSVESDWSLPRPQKDGKVIVVDKQTAASEQWRKLLKLQGFNSVWVNSGDDESILHVSENAKNCEFIVLTEEALQRSAIFNFVVETAGKAGHCPIVAVLSPFAISLREKLLSLSVQHVLVRPCLPDDILLAISGQLELGDHIWDGDVDFIAEISRSLNILIADDTYTNRFILQSMLEEGGHKVTAVTNGQELFDQVSASIVNDDAPKFDVVFTDVQMPILDGITATRRIREMESHLGNVHTTIIAVTAHAMNEEKSRMREAGVDDVITKPVEPAEVARVLVKVSEDCAQEPNEIALIQAQATPIKQTKIVIGNEVDLEAVAERVWTQFLQSGGDLGELVQTAVDGQEVKTDKDGLHSFLNVQETFERSGGSLRRTLMIFRAFLSSFKDVLAHVAQAKSERNQEELRKASHSLKGILLEIGAKNPGKTAGNVEQLCNDGKLEEALKLISPVTHQTLAAARILEKIVEAVEQEQKVPQTQDGGKSVQS